MFPGLSREALPPAGPRSSSGPPLNGASPKYLRREASRWHLRQSESQNVDGPVNGELCLSPQFLLHYSAAVVPVQRSTTAALLQLPLTI